MENINFTTPTKIMAPQVKDIQSLAAIDERQYLIATKYIFLASIGFLYKCL